MVKIDQETVMITWIKRTIRDSRVSELAELQRQVESIDTTIDHIEKRVAIAERQFRDGVKPGEIHYSLENAYAYKSQNLPFYIQQRQPLALRIQELERKLA